MAIVRARNARYLDIMMRYENLDEGGFFSLGGVDKVKVHLTIFICFRMGGVGEKYCSPKFYTSTCIMVELIIHV